MAQIVLRYATVLKHSVDDSSRGVTAGDNMNRASKYESVPYVLQSTRLDHFFPQTR